MTVNKLDRRTMVKATGAVAAGGLLAGCISDSEGTDGGGGGDGDGNTVSVGPDNSLKFDPEEITVSTGDTVTWEFDSPGHNVSAWPDMSDEVSIPDGAEGFGTMEKGGDEFAKVSKGETFEHTFETAGEYTYVCVPHVGSGMIATVVVEE
jgi:plastocyanin